MKEFADENFNFFKVVGISPKKEENAVEKNVGLFGKGLGDSVGWLYTTPMF